MFFYFPLLAQGLLVMFCCMFKTHSCFLKSLHLHHHNLHRSTSYTSVSNRENGHKTIVVVVL